MWVIDRRSEYTSSLVKKIFYECAAGGSDGGSAHAQGRCMTSHAPRPLDRLASDWEARRRSQSSKDALRALVQAEPDLARLQARDLGDLVDALIGSSLSTRRATRGPGERARAAALFRVVLRAAPVHPLVPRALVQALLPGLVGVARRLTWGQGGEWESQATFFVDAITTAWEVVEEWGGQDRAYAVLDVLSAVRCRLRRRILRHRHLQLAEVLASDDGGLAGLAAPGESDAEELARAISRERRQLDAGDAAVLYAHRVLGYSLSELSARSGHSRRFLAACRDRAVGTLIA